MDPLREQLERTLGFQYGIVRLLGRGGMGAVYQAHERALDREVAIKVLPPEAADSGDGRERFLREARTAARLTHPHIVPLHTFGEVRPEGTGEPGLLYYVMGYVDGESLEARLRRVGRIPPEEAARILAELADALDYAHRQGVVHRDVKPDNILIEHGTGVAKLTDFGIAKRHAGGETLTGTGLIVGTPRYMSPEQAAGERSVDARSDVYSLGVVGYAMLAGRPPFEGGLQEVIAQQVSRTPVPLRSVAADVPAHVDRAIARAMEKDPARRFPGAAAMAAALREEEDPGASLSFRRPGRFAITSLASVVVWFDLSWWIWYGAPPYSPRWLAASVVLLPLGLAGDIVAARVKDGMSWREIRRMCTEPPRWWPFWWPARWRRRDDVWPRLPRALRVGRTLSSIGVYMGAAALELGFLFVTGTRSGAVAGPFGRAIGATILTMLGLFAGSVPMMAAGVAVSLRWARRHGVARRECDQLCSRPTASLAFWRQPHVARWLVPETPAELIREEALTPAALVASIAALAVELPAGAPREAGGEAAAAARRLAASIEAVDRELSALGRDFDPAESARLAQRLASLGPDGAADEPEERRAMRDLYTTQRDLLRRIERQLADLAARRAELHELLRTLWLQLAALRAQLRADAANDALDAAEITGRIRSLCGRIEAQTSAVGETSRLLA